MFPEGFWCDSAHRRTYVQNVSGATCVTINRLLHERSGALPREESGNTSGGSRAVSVTSLAEVGDGMASVHSSDRELLLRHHHQGSLRRTSTPPTGMVGGATL